MFATDWQHVDALPSEPLPWLYRTAYNAIGNERRRDARNSRVAERMALLRPAGAFDATTEIDDRDVVARALRQLTSKDREALLLTTWEDLDTAAAAAVMGVSGVALRVRLHRARRRLATLLGPDGVLGSDHEGRSTPKRSRTERSRAGNTTSLPSPETC